MKYGIDKIVRVYAVRVLFYENNHEKIYPWFFIVGKNVDGSYYFRNPYTELPNEFNQRKPEYIEGIFNDTIKLIDIIDNQSYIIKKHRADEIWNFHIWYQNGEEDDLRCENVEDIYFKFINDNDIIISDDSSCLRGSHRSSTMITIDEFRNEVKMGYISFQKLWYYILKENGEPDDIYANMYEIQQDGGVVIYEADFDEDKRIYIVIDKDGVIQEAGDLKYVNMLKEYGIKVKLNVEDCEDGILY